MDEKNQSKFEEWLKEAIGSMATIQMTLKEAGFDRLDSDAELKALYEKGIRPFFYFVKDGENGAAPGPAATGDVAVFIADGDGFRNDEQAKTYTFRKEMRDLGLAFDKSSYGWGGKIPASVANGLKAKYPRLKVTVG